MSARTERRLMVISNCSECLWLRLPLGKVVLFFRRPLTKPSYTLLEEVRKPLSSSVWARQPLTSTQGVWIRLDSFPTPPSLLAHLWQGPNLGVPQGSRLSCLARLWLGNKETRAVDILACLSPSPTLFLASSTLHPSM